MGLTLPQALYHKILTIHNSDTLWPILIDAWEARIIPVLFELEKRSDIQRHCYDIEGKEIFFEGNDPEMLSFLDSQFPKSIYQKPEWFIYVFTGLTDLGLLRRINEFPDESSRAEIENTWLGLCEETASFMIINPIYKNG